MKTVVLKAATAIVLGAGFLASAVAAPPSLYEEVTVKVSYADLDINKEAGARVLYERLRSATEKACDLDGYRKDRSLSRYNNAKECFDETLEQAVDRIQSAALQDIHTG